MLIGSAEFARSCVRSRTGSALTISSDIEGTLLHLWLQSFHSFILWATLHPHPQIQTEANPIPQWAEFAGHVVQILWKFAEWFDALTTSSDSQRILSGSHGGLDTLILCFQIPEGSSLPSRFLISSTEVWKEVGV